MNLPTLRFPEFNNEWNKKTIESLTVSLNAGVSVNSFDKSVTSEEIGVLKTSCISKGFFNPDENKKVIEEDISRVKEFVEGNTILVSRMNTPNLVGDLVYIDKDYPNLYLPDRLWKLILDSNLVNTKWFSYCLLTPKISNFIRTQGTGTSGSMKNIAKPDFLKIAVNLPDLLEQEKIAEFLSALDKKIQIQHKKISLLKKQKKGFVKKIFSRELRFKDKYENDFPNWKEHKLNEFAEKIVLKNKDLKVKNVLSNSAKKGLIVQTDYFDKEIANQENINGYYIISNGDFVYNPRISVDAPYEPINIYHGTEDGIVSPLYTCFKVKGINKEFLYQYFKSSEWYKFIYLNGDSGARHDRVSIKDTTFFALPIQVPCQDEQAIIADFLSEFQQKIEFEECKLNYLLSQKQAFMQQMFV